MGTWGPGPFDNDAAAELVVALQTSPARHIAKVLRDLAAAPPGKFIDIDDSGAGWAACEMVALAFGYGDTGALGDSILDAAGKLRPKEEHRLLALEALPRIADRTNSELAKLWHEGPDGARFDAAIEHLRSRLQAARDGPRELPKPKAGDVLALQAEPAGTELIVVQVVGSEEVAVFDGTCSDETAALACVGTQPALRVPASARGLLRRGRVLGNVPLRKELKAKKLYAREAGAIEGYFLVAASGGAMRDASYDEAREYGLHRPYNEGEIRALALGAQRVDRVRSPDEREAAWRARNAEKFATRRQTTAPGPFGDAAALQRWLQWIEEFGVDNAVHRHHDEAVGRQGYGRPNEESERRCYAFAGLVAIWRGAWPRDTWPSELAGRLPPPPVGKLIPQALHAARLHADRVLTRDAELRLIWDGAPDKGAALRQFVASLQRALAGDASGRTR